MAAPLETPRTSATSKHAAWRALEDHHKIMRGLHLRNLFADDPSRQTQPSLATVASHAEVPANGLAPLSPRFNNNDTALPSTTPHATAAPCPDLPEWRDLRWLWQPRARSGGLRRRVEQARQRDRALQGHRNLRRGLCGKMRRSFPSTAEIGQ